MSSPKENRTDNLEGHGSTKTTKVYTLVATNKKSIRLEVLIKGTGQYYCVYLGVVRQCKNPTRKQHIWFFADTKANAKKPKELFFANARQNEMRTNRKTKKKI